MARINRISITLCALLFTTLPFTPMAHASKQARESSATTHITKKADKKKSTATTRKSNKASQKTAQKAASKSTTKSKTASSVKKFSVTASKNAKTRSKHVVNKTASASFTEKCTKRKGYKSHCVKVKNAIPGTIADAHKAKVQKATKVAMNKLMQQIGKPYRWGGSSPRTGFDCSGLVYYAYKDLVKIRIPRTANEMYHLRDAAPIDRSELKNGDLVFFRTQGRGTADHVGVYVGNGKFIQSPRSGQEIQITSLSEDYWQRHYVGARRVMTPKTLR
ncbi:peptidoglycan DD-endopeptidase MepH [Escherichia albertii]|uniref:peptidoglycan DD-endopeptidase MepH n=1 Tax=Escherichia albertii TaxID=208962 RepID=UPI0007438E76|nr:peptidoglycan DD-endopeptidase MepH [Escherichia albertii]